MKCAGIKNGFNHAEAFCWMEYQCEKCGYRELIYNTRDGVTPFVVACSKCGGSSSHINWNRDFCDPDHKPLPGERVFVNITRDKAKEYAEKRLRLFREKGVHLPPEEGSPEYKDLLERLISDIYGEGDSPTSVIITEKESDHG